MKQALFFALLLTGEVTAQTMTLSQTAAAIAVQDSKLNDLINTIGRLDRSTCPKIQSQINGLKTLGQRINDNLGYTPGIDLPRTYLSLAKFSQDSALSNIKKAYRVLCTEAKNQNTNIFVDIYKELADKDNKIAGFYLAASEL